MLNFRKLVKPGIGVFGSLGAGVVINYSIQKAFKKETVKAPETPSNLVDSVHSANSPQPITPKKNYSERSLENLKTQFPQVPPEILQVIIKADILGSGIDWVLNNSNLTLSDIINPYNCTILATASIGVITTLTRKRPIVYNKAEFLRKLDGLKKFRNQLKDLEKIKNEKIFKIESQGLKRGARENIELINNKYLANVKTTEQKVFALIEGVGNRELQRKLVVHVLNADKNYLMSSYISVKGWSGKILDESRLHNGFYAFLFLSLCGIAVANEFDGENRKNNEDAENVENGKNGEIGNSEVAKSKISTTINLQSAAVFISTFSALKFATPFLHFKTGLIFTPHFISLAASQLFRLQNTTFTKSDEARITYIKHFLGYIFLPASLIFYSWFTVFRSATLKNTRFGKFSAKEAKKQFNTDGVKLGCFLSSHMLMLSGANVIASLNSRAVDKKVEVLDRTVESLENPQIFRKSREENLRALLEKQSYNKVQDDHTIVAAESDQKSK